jgi:hypothetical protein
MTEYRGRELGHRRADHHHLIPFNHCRRDHGTQRCSLEHVVAEWEQSRRSRKPNGYIPLSVESRIALFTKRGIRVQRRFEHPPKGGYTNMYPENIWSQQKYTVFLFTDIDSATAPFTKQLLTEQKSVLGTIDSRI